MRYWCFSPVQRSFAVVVLLAAAGASAQPVPRGREFPPGSLNRIQELPAGRFRARIERLPLQAQQRALAWLRSFHFTEQDLLSLEADDDGGVYYIDHFTLEAPAEAPAEPVVAEAALPVSPFPASLMFHSKPGAPNVLFLNFAGENVSGTAWNSPGQSVIPAVAFSTDSDYANFSDLEQLAIKRVWQRVAEDYAPFDIDVTTERPVTFTTRTAHALITRNTDANGAANPSSTAGGVGYVNVFGTFNYASSRPVWVYHNNLANSESYIAEAASHEIGHNMGLSHDGKTDGASYYGGHGSGDTSWGPIMGTGYGRNVSQWSRGEYYLANNTQDDLSIIAGKVPYRADDHGDSRNGATALVVIGGTNVVSTTLEADPSSTNRANKGILERNTDVDVFSFSTGSGAVSLSVNPWIMPSGTRGGNLDVLLELYDANGTLLLTNNSSSQTTAQIQTTLVQGTYYLYVRNTGAGDPFSSAPSGYTPYAAIGRYFISGHIAPSGAITPLVQLTATANNAAWGSVNPSNGNFAAGSTVQVTATPAPYYRFLGWTNAAAGTNNPVTLLLNTNVTLQAVFGEMVTTNHPTPYSWLASYGFTSNFENAAESIGANGIRLWQSYLAGLNPTNSGSQLRLAITRTATGNVLSWSTATGRLYTIWSSTNLSQGFTRLSGASNLPSSVQRFTNSVPSNARAVFYRIEVVKP